MPELTERKSHIVNGYGDLLADWRLCSVAEPVDQIGKSGDSLFAAADLSQCFSIVAKHYGDLLADRRFRRVPKTAD